MKKSKKVLFGITAILIAISFTGCDILFGALGGGSEVQHESVSVEVSGDVFIHKYNLSNTTINYNKTGYVYENPEANRAAEDVEILDTTNSNNPSTLPEDMHNNVEIEQMNAQLMEALMSNEANRASGTSYAYYTIDESSDTVMPGNDKDFHYISGKDANGKNVYGTENFFCYATNDKCNVWFFDDMDITSYGKKISDLKLNILADTFKKICTAEEEIVGGHIYTKSIYGNFIDPKSKINIVVADLFGDASADQDSGTYGYFSSTDLIRLKRYDDPEDFEDYDDISNHDMIIYIDTNFLLKDPNAVYSTIVHEYNHLLNFVNKTIIKGVGYDTWFTEMLAMTCEDLFQNYLGLDANENGPIKRLPYYFTENAYYGFTTWYTNDDVYFAYANAYAFGAYLVRNYGGVELLTEIATNGYGNIEAITKATGETIENLMIDYADTLLYPTYSTSEYKNLNHKVEYSKNSELFFPAIDLTQLKYFYWKECTRAEYFTQIAIDEDETKEKDGKYYLRSWVTSEPLYFLAGDYRPIYSNKYNLTKYYTVTLAPYGMSIHYVGRNIDSFEWVAGNNKARYVVLPAK